MGLLPPLSEQAAIVRYLDYVDRRVRRLVWAKQKLIKLLEEQKQAIISGLVTGKFELKMVKGEDGKEHSHLTPRPSHLMKPSGVECLGGVPKHWEVRRLKSLVRHIDQGVSPQAENRLAENGAWGVLKAGCVNYGIFRQNEHKRLPTGFKFDPNLTIQEGDVLVSRASGSPHLVGSVGRVSALKYNLILSDKTFRPIFNQDVYPDFMIMVMNCRYYRNQVKQAISGAEGLANNLPLSSLRAFAFIIPPHENQRSIIEYLQKATESLRTAIARAEREIELLREYRTRLIADAVTGKLDVREAAARLPEELDEPNLMEDDIEEQDEDKEETDEAKVAMTSREDTLAD